MIWQVQRCILGIRTTIALWCKNNIVIIRSFQVQNLDEVGMDLLQKMLVYDPVKRISAKVARRHRYFRDVKLPSGLGAHAAYIRYAPDDPDNDASAQSV